jgi:hypothetical protein
MIKRNKITLTSKIKKLASGLWFNYIKRPISNLWYRNVKKPYQSYKENKAKLAYTKKIQNTFTKSFANHSEVIKLMYDIKLTQTNEEDLLKDIVSNRREMFFVDTKNKPFLYEPDIIEIHNENLNLNNPTLTYIIGKDNEKASEILREQQRILNLKNGIVIPKNKQERPMTSSIFDETRQDDLESYVKEVSIKGIRNLDAMVGAEKFNSFMKNIEKSKNK